MLERDELLTGKMKRLQGHLSSRFSDTLGTEGSNRRPWLHDSFHVLLLTKIHELHQLSQRNSFQTFQSRRCFAIEGDLTKDIKVDYKLDNTIFLSGNEINSRKHEKSTIKSPCNFCEPWQLSSRDSGRNLLVPV